MPVYVINNNNTRSSLAEVTSGPGAFHVPFFLNLTATMNVYMKASSISRPVQSPVTCLQGLPSRSFSLLF